MLLHAWITGNPSVPNPITTRRMSMTLKESGGRMLSMRVGHFLQPGSACQTAVYPSLQSPVQEPHS